jgi:MFS family permease
MTTATSARAELFGPQRRTTTTGLLLLISMIAFEAMGVGTAMPAVVADLGVVALYAWPFVAFMAASVVATVLGGRWCDVAGARTPLLVAPVVFGIGLAVAGTAGSMAQLLAGRVLQGLGAGVAIVSAYVMIAVVYPQRVRPAVFGWMSAAWVLPSLVGPPVAGVVTERLSWHWVFLGLVPVVLVALGLIVPAARGLRAPQGDPAPARRGLVPAALGAALGVAGLSWASQRLGVPGAVVAGVALVALVPSLGRLLPAGTVRFRRGIPTVVASRGLLAGTFFTANTYVPLLLTDTHGWSLTAAGIPLVVASLGWSTASAWQGRHPDLPRSRLLLAGFCCVAVGTAGLALAAPSWGPPWLAFPVWLVAGVGMGLGYSAISYLVLAQSAPNDVGFHTSAAQLADQLGSAALIGSGGALLVLLVTPAVALPVLMIGLTVLAVLGACVAPRTAGPIVPPAPGSAAAD